ncbi:helix-turn-helix transcriptional regulator [Citrobacter gillenii]|uniref:HTH luxR-type domain-containing protein n=1 Tax=Citrobacter gillenii TaxID=67828 RepID=A0ABD6M8C2_9ENTR|nr:hypothetical protein [Citrobacter gillenii]NTZ52939.1 hypothetical protein [Citrobacter gillenii]
MISILSKDFYFINGISHLIKKIPSALLKRMPCKGEICIVDVSCIDNFNTLKKKKFCHFIFILKNKNILEMVPNLRNLTFDYSVVSRNDTHDNIYRIIITTLLSIVKGQCLMKGITSPNKTRITPREIQLINYASQGFSVSKIGKLLSISHKGVYALKRCFMVKINSSGMAGLYFAVGEMNVISSIISVQGAEGGGDHAQTFYCRSISP